MEQRTIIAGIYDSIIQNYLNRVKGNRSVGDVIFCQGMPFASDALAAAVARQTGSEVIVPPKTFIATASAVAMCGATPVFADIEPASQCLDPAQLERHVSPRTRAVIAVHLGGWPADMVAIGDVARRHGLAVIEDCAQSHGATFRGKKCGAIGDAAGFSLQSTKLLTSGSYGGLFATDDDQIAERAKLLQYLGEIVVPGRERQEQQYNDNAS